ncbi:MAG: ion channel [Desulfobaccales bacterium]
MKLSKPQPWHSWSAESGLTALLIFTLAYLFVVSALGFFSFGGLVGRLLFSLILVAGVLTSFRQRWLGFCAIVLAVASFILTWVEHIHQEWSLTILSAILGMIFIFFLVAILIVQVFQRGTVTAHRIRGAIVVYLLMGGMWSFLYYIVALTIPEAFNWPKGLAVGDWQAVQQVLTYFSFTTLTTLGLGDVTPAIPLTRTLAMFEGLAGQLYLVITLTRLVSLSIVCPDVTQNPD